MTIKAQDLLFAPIETKGTVEQVFRRIGEAIGSGLLQAGARLPSEAELAQRFQVAPMTMRQALAALRSEGYIDTRRGRGGGSFVRADALQRSISRAISPSWSIERLEELTIWRCAVSGESAARAALYANGEQVDELHRFAATAATHIEEPASYRPRDAQFHIAIAESVGSKRLISAEIEIQSELSELIAPMPGAPLVRQASGRGHETIMEAIETHQADRARNAVVDHAEATRDWLIGLHLGREDGAIDE